ncbi:MAG: hypothetical protein LBB37_03385 [Endomicrobium sp.]|jgi:hypothetical protein|nr:hypothetical protein [Endomicrobium sp.]
MSFEAEMIIFSVNAIYYKSPNVEKGLNKKEISAIIETSKELLVTAMEVMKKK